jgi:hypothetical protein
VNCKYCNRLSSVHRPVAKRSSLNFGDLIIFRV